ncbi:hypothetical protein DITRI_Ditri04bG0002500 [Diplodiscus trichospermus]
MSVVRDSHPLCYFWMSQQLSFQRLTEGHTRRERREVSTSVINTLIITSYNSLCLSEPVVTRENLHSQTKSNKRNFLFFPLFFSLSHRESCPKTMDVDFWPSKVHSSRHLSVVRAARFNSDGHYDDFEGDEDARACFPCPFCYVEIEIHALCNHLQEEHCFELKNAVCPLCAANLGKDVVGHFMVQHASSLKRRRKSQKSGIWLGSSATLGRELSSFIGSSTGGRGNAHESAPESFLSPFPPFLYNGPVSDTTDIQGDKCSDDEAAAPSNLKRSEPKSPDKDDEQNKEETRQRAAFVQQLVMSTIF